MTSLELASGGTAEFSEGDLYFIGNATTLIRFGGLPPDGSRFPAQR